MQRLGTGLWPGLCDRSARTGLAALILLLASACGPSDSTAPSASSPPPKSSSAERERPNLLLITVDTLRADRLFCYGGSTAAGIVLCDLFRGGVRYAWAFSTAPSTAPSVASILTSRYPRDHGVTQHAQTRLSEEIVTLAEVLSRAGYATGAVISNPVIRKARNLDQGFDFYEDRMTRAERNRPMLLERAASEATDLALDWARDATQPWFLWLHYQDPHGPYEPPDATPVRDAKADERLPLLEDESGWRGIPLYQAHVGLRTRRAYEWRYVQEIRYLERHIARLVTGLDELGSPPAILLTADHGEAFGEDEFYFAHGHSLGIDQIHVPLLWRPVSSDRGADPARVVPTPVTILDVAPTLLDEAGAHIPEIFQGQPLPRDAAALASTGDGERSFFAEHRLRIALISGQTYYARDRQLLAQPVPDAVTGGLLPPLPPRTALLSRDGGWPVYEPAPQPEAATGADLQRERMVLDFLAAAARAREHAEDLDPVTQDALRALGYLE
jgi:arylsulfatase A-like enzyme